ncbi:MAG: taurine catabolism dioxygenase TauD [Rhodospirillaceae bacterium]|nr:taurine catabolism dioxygenase TauD [Rhodospirillaceae bacterium]
MSSIEVNSTGKALGAVISGIDLSQEVSESDRKLIFDAYVEHMVVLFRGQSLSFDDLLRLREVFGSAGKTANQLLGLGRKKYYPDEVPDDITIISNIIDKGGRPRGSLGDGEAFWHTDSSFTEQPISASLLHAIEVSETGGETAFLNMYQAYEELPDDLRAQVDGAFANHSKVHSSDGSKRPEYDDVTDVSKAPGVRHPLVRVHPNSGKKCLFLGRRLNSYIFDHSVEESEELLDAIWAHTCRDRYVWEHKWDVGDLLVWDNRCTMHHRNAFPADARRLMHKSITAGEAVIAA